MSMSEKTASVLEALQYVKKFSGQTILLKLGGSILTDENLVKSLCEDLSLLRAANVAIIIVHGGGKAINAALDTYGLTSHQHNGQRVTSVDMMKIVEMVIGGQVNPMLVRTLNSVGVNAIGLKGTDSRLLQCERFDAQLGEVGIVKKINTPLLKQHIDAQFADLDAAIPVIAPIGIDEQGMALNINADWAASAIASVLQINKIIYLTDQDGIYNEKGEIYSELNIPALQKLIDDGIVKDGMLTKIHAIIDCLSAGIQHLHIINGSKPHALITELYTDQGIGTICLANTSEEVSYA